LAIAYPNDKRLHANGLWALFPSNNPKIVTNRFLDALRRFCYSGATIRLLEKFAKSFYYNSIIAIFSKKVN
jgi:hypothetical protein